MLSVCKYVVRLKVRLFKRSMFRICVRIRICTAVYTESSVDSMSATIMSWPTNSIVNFIHTYKFT